MSHRKVLRPYQVKMVSEICDAISQGAKSILVVAPTGSGKTKIVSAALRKAGLSALGIAHRVEICRQIRSEFLLTGPTSYEVMGISSSAVNSIVRDQKFDALFIDEAHHSAASSYRRIIANRGRMILISATATPYRTDGVSLTPIFERVVVAPSAAELCGQGYLARVKYVGAEDVDFEGVKLTKKNEFEAEDALRRVRVAVQAGDLVAAWNKYARNAKALIYAINLEHCEEIFKELKLSRISAEIVSSRSSRSKRKSHIDAFEDDRIKALINCEVFTEGTDLRGVGAIIMLRPTNSRALYKQMIGRGMRPDVPCVVLDHVGNHRRHGNVMTEDPLEIMRSAKLERAAVSESSPPMDVSIQRMDLHVERVDCRLATVWTPSIFSEIAGASHA